MLKTVTLSLRQNLVTSPYSGNFFFFFILTRSVNASFILFNPQDLLRTIGKIEKSDWNLAAIERKMHENKFGVETQMSKEKVPKWNRDAYDDKVRQTLRERKKERKSIG